MKNLAITLVLACVVLVGEVQAQFWDPLMSHATMDPAAQGACVVVRPDGAGRRFDQAYDQQGGIVDATITLTLVDWNGLPIAGLPAEDLWLVTSDGGLQACDDGAVADADTDQFGQTVWREPLRAGGCSVGETVHVMVIGTPLSGPGLELVFRGPDLTGDRLVNLSDITAFVQLYGDIGAGSCADFNNDGVVNLSDIAIMAPAIGAACD